MFRFLLIAASTIS